MEGKAKVLILPLGTQLHCKNGEVRQIVFSLSLYIIKANYGTLLSPAAN